jgi:hypothetical protein
MQLPHLTQDVLLDRGMAWPLVYYLAAEQRALLRRDPTQGQRLTTTEALSLAPLAKLLKQLERLHERDKRPAPKKPRPHKLKVAFPELTTIRFYYARLLASAAWHPDGSFSSTESHARIPH